MLLVKIYVDDIIFGSTHPSLCEEFSKSMHNEFEMSKRNTLRIYSKGSSSIKVRLHKLQ